MRKLSRSLAAALALTVALTSVPSVSVLAYDGYDSTAPIADNVTSSKTEYSVGDVLDISTYITEEESGIADAYITLSAFNHYINQQIHLDGITSDGSCLSGTYSTNYIIPDTVVADTYVVSYVHITDMNGNVYSSDTVGYQTVITITNDEDERDTTAPTLNTSTYNSGVYFSKDSYEIPGNIKFYVCCDDNDLATINYSFANTVYTGSDIRGSVSFSEASENGEYEVNVEFPETAKDGVWSLYYIQLTDNEGNSSSVNCSAQTSVYHTEEQEEYDTEAPIITSVEGSTEDVYIPGYSSLNISGTENIATSVNASVMVSRVDGSYAENINISSNTEVVNGNWEIFIDNITFSNNSNAGTYYVSWIQVSDEDGNDNDNWYTLENSPASWTVKHDQEVVNQVSLKNPNIINIIENMNDDAVLSIKMNSETIIPAELFTAIDNSNKTLVFDIGNGMSWTFKGSTIEAENVKDVDVTMFISNGTSLEEYGYDNNVNGVVIGFAPNGILPGTVQVRLKSDYIAKTFGLNDNLYLACIKSTVEVEEEITNYRYIWPTDENGNEIYYTVEYSYNEDGNIIMIKEYSYNEDGDILLDEDGNEIYTEYPLINYVYIEPEIVEEIETINYDKDNLVQIEDAGITLDSYGFVNLTMTHNSSYVLSSSLPKVAKEVSNTTDNSNTPAVNDTNNSCATIPDVKPTDNTNTNDVSVTESTKQLAEEQVVSTEVKLVDETNTNDNTTSATESTEESSEEQGIPSEVKPVDETNSNIVPASEPTNNKVSSKKFSKFVSKVTSYKNYIKLNLKKSSFKGYQIRYSANSNMRNSKYTFSKNGNKIIKNLKSNKKYYIQVRYYNMKNGKKVYSAWSDIKSVRTKK